MPDGLNSRQGDTTLLSNISERLDALAERTFRLEEAVGQSLSENVNTSDTNRLVELQSLDFLRQSLEDLAILMHFIDRHVPAAIQNSFPAEMASKSLKLAATQSVLDTQVTQETIEQTSTTGKVELF